MLERIENYDDHGDDNDIEPPHEVLALLEYEREIFNNNEFIDNFFQTNVIREEILPYQDELDLLRNDPEFSNKKCISKY